MAKVDVKKLTPEVKKKYKVYNNALRLDLIKNPEKDRKGEPKDEINVIIGDDKQPDKFYPQVKICRWSNEVNLSFRLKEDDEEEPVIDFDYHKVLYKKNKRECHFYHIEPNELLKEGGYEFEVILKEKPSTNKLEFTINTKGLRFYYQSPLTEEITEEQKEKGWMATETEIRDEKGKRVCYRPENVVGSYAIYHESKGVLNDKNGKDYKVGKVGHIYRPKVKDANGNEIWGELNIDEGTGTLTITIDQNWLDNAVYPVIIDPTFGYDVIGGSETSADPLCPGGVIASPGQSGTADSISFYIYNQGSPAYKHGAALYKKSDGSHVANSSIIDTPDSWQWNTANLNGESISDIDYYIAIAEYFDFGPYFYNGGITNIKYDSGSSGDSFTSTEMNEETEWPATISPTVDNKKYSIYCTYTVGGESVTVTPTAQSVNVGQLSPTITAQQSVSITSSVQAITSSQVAPTITVQKSVSVSLATQILTTALLTISLGLGVGISANAQTGNLLQETPTISTQKQVVVSVNSQIASLSQESPVITAQKQATISVNVQVLAAGQELPTISTEEITTITLSVQSLSSLQESPTVFTQRSATILAGFQGLASGQEAPTISVQQSISIEVSVQSITSSSSTASISTGTTVLTSAQLVNSGQIVPSVTTNVIVSLSSQVLTSGQLSVVISGQAVTSFTAQTLILSVVSPSTLTEATISTNAQEVSATQISPTISVEGQITIVPSIQGINIFQNTVSLSYGYEISVSEQSLTAGQEGLTIITQGGIVVSLSIQGGVLIQPDLTVVSEENIVVSLNATTGTFTINSPTIFVQECIDVFPTVQSLNSFLPAVTISGNIVIATSVQDLTFSQPVALVVVNQVFEAGVQGLTSDVLPVIVLRGIVADVSVQALNSLVQSPTISTQGYVVVLMETQKLNFDILGYTLQIGLLNPYNIKKDIYSKKVSPYKAKRNIYSKI